MGEARLWYHSLEPLGETTGAQLQNLFRQTYSKLGNTSKQLFHAWRSFSFDENTETIDSYVIRIRQVANLLGYGEPQILEVFKNTLLTKLYWILFPIEDLRQAVDMAKRILTKEKLDKELTSQTSMSPFMSVRDGTDRRVSFNTFNTKDELGDKIDKLTVVMSKLPMKDSHERKLFKPQIYKCRGQNRSYGQGGYQARSGNGNRAYGLNNNSRQNNRGNRFRRNFRGYGRQNSRENYYRVLGTIRKSFAYTELVTEPILLYLLLLRANVVCDLYFDSHILVVLIITLILIIHIIHIIGIKCVYVREYYEYSLTANKSLL